MKVVKFHKKYINHAKELAGKNGKFNLPDLTSPLILLRAAIKDKNDNIVGYGFIKLIGEAILVVDKELVMSERAEVIDIFHKVSARAAKKKGLDEIDAFVTNDRAFVNFLLKRLDYKDSGAQVLVKRL
jgi:hypothetical protein